MTATPPSGREFALIRRQLSRKPDLAHGGEQQGADIADPSLRDIAMNVVEALEALSQERRIAGDHGQRQIEPSPGHVAGRDHIHAALMRDPVARRDLVTQPFERGYGLVAKRVGAGHIRPLVRHYKGQIVTREDKTRQQQ